MDVRLVNTGSGYSGRDGKKKYYHRNSEEDPTELGYDSEIVRYEILPSADIASKAVAHEIKHLIQQRAEEGRMVVLGLATGKTPVPLYRELVRLHREEDLSFANVISFNLDEYFGMSPSHPQSYRTFMQQHFFDAVDLLPQHAHLLLGNLEPGNIGPHCRAYEEMIEKSGGIDLQLLGIGRTGHIGFNEPGSDRCGRTSLVRLNDVTRTDAAEEFGDKERVPSHAISMGCGTILEAKRIILMAWGNEKSQIVAEALNGPITEDVPASYLQDHPNVSIYLDHAAARDLMVVKRFQEKEHLLKE